MRTNKLFNYIQKKLFGLELISQAAKIDTYGANGVQIWGEEHVSKIALGVSCNAEFLEKASNWGAQVCIFHHGLNLGPNGFYNFKATPSTQKQLKLIFNNDLTIAGYHYVLDVHKTLGNNAQIINALGAQRLEITYCDSWGWVAELPQNIYVQEFATLCSKVFKHDVFMILGGPEKIKRIGVCSGSTIPRAADIFEIKEKQIDLHLTGVITEAIAAQAKESAFHYFACGHYATEVFGIKALGEQISEAFPELEVRFIDVWNEL